VRIKRVSLPEALPSLRGERIMLREFRADDAALISEASEDPVIPLITTVPASPGVTEALAFIDRQHSRLTSGQGYSFAIARKDTDEAVGQIGLWLRDIASGRASVGYWIVASARRRGYASDAIAVLTVWGLSLPEIHRLELYVEPWNEGSWRAAEQNRYRREGLLRSWQTVGGERRDMYMYSRLKADVG
jgi:RimJ/RimL family protein N-acetyltransferase